MSCLSRAANQRPIRGGAQSTALLSSAMLQIASLLAVSILLNSCANSDNRYPEFTRHPLKNLPDGWIAMPSSSRHLSEERGFYQDSLSGAGVMWWNDNENNYYDRDSDDHYFDRYQSIVDDRKAQVDGRKCDRYLILNNARDIYLAEMARPIVNLAMIQDSTYNRHDLEESIKRKLAKERPELLPPVGSDLLIVTVQHSDLSMSSFGSVLCNKSQKVRVEQLLFEHARLNATYKNAKRLYVRTTVDQISRVTEGMHLREVFHTLGTADLATHTYRGLGPFADTQVYCDGFMLKLLLSDTEQKASLAFSRTQRVVSVRIE